MNDQASFALRGRNPDVLTCIANLSNDEVFTPPELANRMLDMLAETWAANNGGADLWADSTVRFLDPFTKSGVFLREIASRLTRGLAAEIPDLQERVNHILIKQVFGIGITYLTSLLARRSLYCSKHANGPHSIARDFTGDAGNIWFERVEHMWVDGRCRFCGASQNTLDRGEVLETHAYAFIHTDDIRTRLAELFGGDMQFDVIIGNPPYQLGDGGGGGGASATPIYNKFIEAALSLEPRYVAMITPSRWFSGGKGLEEFRDRMLRDHRFVKLVDFPQLYDVFPGVKIRGGVSYWLWSIGQDLSSRFAAEGWGTKVVDRLAKDLGTEFPGVEGFSLRNLRYMRSFAEAWPDPEILQLAAKLPWGHHMVLLDRLKDGQSRDWYMRASIEYGWSRNVLTHHISTQLRDREGKALTNFARTLPAPDSDLTQQILKDPYSFEFLTLSSTAKERELERGLLKHLRDLMLELGRGFSFVGSQVPLEIGGETFYIDLLFYHLRLHCYFVIELKTGKFKPEWAGKLNFYLSAVDDLFRNGPDAPTIGLFLCETNNSALAEYALRDVAKPIGVSTYRVTRELPGAVRDELPTVEDLQEVVAKLRSEMEQLRQERDE